MMTGRLKIYALIPARGGSKGIPRKNLREFHGIPLVAWKVLQARAAGCDEVWVSTNDREIACLAMLSGAKVLKRPLEISIDTSSTESSINHFIESLDIGEIDLICLLQVTSPLVRVDTIKSCIKLLISNERLNSVFSADMRHPFIWKEEDENWNPLNHDRRHRPRRQDMPHQAIENGACYLFRVGAFKDSQTRFPAPTSVVLSSYQESLDIDTTQDLNDANRVNIEDYLHELESNQIEKLRNPGLIKEALQDFDNNALLEDEWKE